MGASNLSSRNFSIVSVFSPPSSFLGLCHRLHWSTSQFMGCRHVRWIIVGEWCSILEEGYLWANIWAAPFNSCLHNFIGLGSSRWYIGPVSPTVLHLPLQLFSCTVGPLFNWNPMTIGLLCRSCCISLAEVGKKLYGTFFLQSRGGLSS